VIHRCEKCDRESRKSKGDLEKDYGWTFLIVQQQEIAVCGTCHGHPPPQKKVKA